MEIDEKKIREDIKCLKLSMDWAENSYQKNWYSGAIETLEELLKEQPPESDAPRPGDKEAVFQGEVVSEAKGPKFPQEWLEQGWCYDCVRDDCRPCKLRPTYYKGPDAEAGA